MRGPSCMRVTACLLVLLYTFPCTWAGSRCPSPGDSCKPYDSSLPKWIASLSNGTRVLRPGLDPDYLTYAPSMNLLKSAQPALIVVPASEADLASTVRFATKHRIRLVVKCSGIDYNDRSTGFGVLQLNTQMLKSITYDKSTQTITTGAGVTWGEVYKYLLGLNRIAVGAKGKTVCVAGCILGGCVGMLSRKYGLGSDQVTAIRFVLYNGTVLTLSNTQHAGLFNAVLGSGHNTYGVALSFTLRTYPAPKQLIRTLASWPVSETVTRPCIIDMFYNPKFFASWPTGFSAFLQASDGTARLDVLYAGDNYQKDSKYLNTLWALPNTLITAKYTYDSMYNYSVSTFEAFGNSYARQFTTNALFDPTPATLNALADSILKHPSVFYHMIYAYGGAVSATTGGSVPVGMRSAMFEIAVGAKWTDPHYDQLYMSNVSVVAGGLYDLTPQSYVNEFTTWYGKYNDLPDWKKRFYANYSSLLKVKQAYDPCNMYTVEYGVGSDLPQGACVR